MRRKYSKKEKKKAWPKLSKISVLIKIYSLTLRRWALLKVGCIFILFIFYAIVNIVYIVMFHNYALLASNQYNDIQMRRALMSDIILMCRQAFFENDTSYLFSSQNHSIYIF